MPGWYEDSAPPWSYCTRLMGTTRYRDPPWPHTKVYSLLLSFHRYERSNRSTPKIMLFFYFESDIPKIFPSDIPVVDWLIDWSLTPTLATCSWNKVNKYQTWLSNVYVGDLLILVTVRVLYMQFKVCHAIYVTVLTNWIIFLEDNFVTIRAIRETLNDDNCYHCSCIKIFTILSYHLKFK